MQTIELNVTGMTCGHCVSHVERAIHELSPNADVKVDLSAGKVTLSDADVTAQLDQIMARLIEEGYQASQDKPVEEKKSGSSRSGGCCCG